MFFILSKILVFLIRPLNWAVILLIVSFFLKSKKRRHHARIGSAAILLFFTNPLIINQLVLHWEAPPVQISELRDTADYAIILGGYFGGDRQFSEKLPQFGTAINRFMSTFQLYKMGHVRKFLLTGGEGSLFGQARNESDEIHDLLRELGVPEADILVENKSRNTHENALFTKNLLDKTAPNATCLLITSAFHMPRAVLCFEKVGQKTTPFPVDFMGKPFKFSPKHLFEPDDTAFDKWNLLLKEWAGIVAYKVKGFI